ncbi:uncharacterized protein LOC111263086 [Varroa jacobsoni]|uniref:uncharacterized protein LOC111263086 n=1 Tax=Varroa jacobsoni TaxID=62625 RepID=UPI000BF9C41F|nr:uncharacterized protein LOC111263086 [Varroa jacobsoni]XP_022693614.1 uncharacterized protein LOC111263086 [Varroa jacobsoni]
MKIECVESLAPAEVPDIPVGTPVASASVPKHGRGNAHSSPYRKIVVTCDTRGAVDPNLVRVAVSSFVKKKVNCLVKEDCIVRLHWNGTDVNSLFLRGIEPLTPQQTLELRGAASYQIDALHNRGFPAGPSATAPGVLQQANGPTTLAITIASSVLNVRSTAPRYTAPRQIFPRPALIRNPAPQLINIPMISMVPVRSSPVTTISHGVRTAVSVPKVIETILPRPPQPQPTILRSPAKPVIVRTPVQMQGSGSSSRSSIVSLPSVNVQEASILPVPIRLRPAIPPTTPVVTPVTASRFALHPAKPTPPPRPSAPSPVMVRFNGRVQAAQPGQLIRRTNGQIVRVMPNGSLEEVEMPVTIPKKVSIKSSREKPISLDTDSEDEPSSPAKSSTQKSDTPLRDCKQESSSLPATGSASGVLVTASVKRRGKKRTGKLQVVDLDDSTSGTETDSTDSCEFIGVDEVVKPGFERRSQRIAATKSKAKVDKESNQLASIRLNDSVKKADSAGLTTESDLSDNNAESLPPSKRKTAEVEDSEMLQYEFFMGSDGVVERVPFIKDLSLLQPDFNMTVGDKEFSKEMIEDMVEKGVQHSLLYAPPENCRLIFRDADELDFMDTVIVQDDGEVKLDPELYQCYMQIVYKELLADHRLFKAEQLRKQQFFKSGRLDMPDSSAGLDNVKSVAQSVAKPLVQAPVATTSPTKQTACVSQNRAPAALEPYGVAPSSGTQKKRGRSLKRPSSPLSRPVPKVKALPLNKGVPPIKAVSSSKVAPPTYTQASDPERPYSVHYLASNGSVKVVKTREEVRTRQCYVIMDKISDYQLAEQIAQDSEGRLKLRQEDGTNLPLHKLFAAQFKEQLYYDHERGQVDPERKRGFKWDCVLRPIFDRNRGVRHPVRMYSYRHRPQAENAALLSSSESISAPVNTTSSKNTTFEGSSDRSASTATKAAASLVDVSTSTSILVGTPISIVGATTVAAVGSLSTAACGESPNELTATTTAKFNIRPLTIETRKKEIVFGDIEDDYVDVDVVAKPPVEEDDSWEAGTSDEDWDIQDTRITRSRKRRVKANANHSSAEYSRVLVHVPGKNNAKHRFFQPATNIAPLHEPSL